MMMRAMTNLTVERMRVMVRRLVSKVSRVTSLSSRSYSRVLVFLLLTVRSDNFWLLGLGLSFLMTVQCWYARQQVGTD